MATILIVDGPRSDPGPLMNTLGRYGHRVLQASSGEMALRIARAESPDVVLADERLPDMDGCQLVKRLRAGWCSRSGVGTRKGANRRVPVARTTWSPGRSSRNRPMRW
jgi:DNA-binding response OmpR family regulator